MKFKRVLILAPHTDDGEIGAGGTIAKLVERGSDMTYIAFSAPRPELNIEFDKAMKVLGVKHHQICDYETRMFYERRQDLLQFLVDLNRELRPDLVLLPTQHDIHQDHKTVSEEGIRAFRKTNILAYELPWNHLVFRSEGFVKLTSKHMRKKLDALKCYNTQNHRSYMNPDTVMGLARTRGMQVGVPFAECYEIVRWVL